MVELMMNFWGVMRSNFDFILYFMVGVVELWM